MIGFHRTIADLGGVWPKSQADGIVDWSGGFRLDFNDGTSRDASEVETLAARKYMRLSELRDEAAALILAKWPAWVQNNCALGIYPEATAAQCAADIAAVISASNTAEDAVTAATTVAEVEAVTATWPTL